MLPYNSSVAGPCVPQACCLLDSERYGFSAAAVIRWTHLTGRGFVSSWRSFVFTDVFVSGYPGLPMSLFVASGVVVCVFVSITQVL